MTGSIHVITPPMLADAIESAAASPRLRVARLFHASASENPQRLLNAMARGTYVPPHRHLMPPKTESIVVLEGYIAFFIFNDNGAIREAYALGQGPAPDRLPAATRANPVGRGIDIPAGPWHSLAVLTPHAVIFEVKPGPWDAATDRELAPWAPAEGDPEAAAYLAGLLDTSC